MVAGCVGWSVGLSKVAKQPLQQHTNDSSSKTRQHSRTGGCLGYGGGANVRAVVVWLAMAVLLTGQQQHGGIATIT